MVQSGYKFRTGLASNYIVYRGLQINYFRIQKKAPSFPNASKFVTR